MKPEEQRIAIAEACGWRFVYDYTYNFDSPPEFTTISPEGRRFCGHYPDYLNSLDAMHEAEKVLSATHLKKYHGVLVADVIGWGAYGNEHIAIHASAAQRAEAFLKTLKLWES